MKSLNARCWIILALVVLGFSAPIRSEPGTITSVIAPYFEDGIPGHHSYVERSQFGLCRSIWHALRCITALGSGLESEPFGSNHFWLRGTVSGDSPATAGRPPRPPWTHLSTRVHKYGDVCC